MIWAFEARELMRFVRRRAADNPEQRVAEAGLEPARGVVPSGDANWHYNPDWAIVKRDDEKLYLVRETKSTKEQEKLRQSEWDKINCGKAHFESLGG